MARRAAVQVVESHEPGDPFAGTPLALSVEFMVDPRGAVGLAGFAVDLDDLGGQFGVTPGPA